MSGRQLEAWEMKALDINNVPLASFDLDIPGRRLTVKVVTGRLTYSPKPTTLGAGTLTFHSWNQIDVNVYSEEQHQWLAPQTPAPDGKLKSLGEVTLDPKQVLLHGDDSKSGQFVCYRLQETQVDAEFEFR